mgnify:CR=1 FL=1
MDHLMLALSLAALVVGAGLAVLAWRLLTGSRTSAERIAALEDAARTWDDSDDAGIA